ncbi:MAG: hypothetical protein WAV20_00820 [Blastocatellia bacterium]
MKTSLSTRLLIVVLIFGLAPASVRAGGNADEDKPIRLYASARFGSIGVIKMNSLSGGGVAVDGRIAQGEVMIWGGELIKALADQRVRVTLDDIGGVTLTRGAMVRFARARAGLDEGSYDVLVAALVQGSIDIKLNSAAGAYIEAAGSRIIAERGARLNLSVEDGRASVVTASGVVRVQDPVPPQDVNIRVVDELGRPVASGSQLSVRARSTRQIQVQVTDKNDKPLPDLPVLFSLGNPCLGSLGLGAVAGATFLQKTDKRGIASVPLLVGAARCAASITAKVEGTNASVSIQTTVQPSTGFFTTQNTVLVVAGAAAAGVVTGLVVSSGGTEPIRPVPPPLVKP